ncbi:(Na+)-NQR maturation NqrM [Methylolobus aquaticus]|nr:(Na+)-NQR maturation NqrM [Methylolobus aquaticus]
MTMFLITFAAMVVVFLLMAVGVIFGRQAIKGTCGGLNGGNCICTQKCEKRLKAEAAAAAQR